MLNSIEINILNHRQSSTNDKALSFTRHINNNPITTSKTPSTYHNNQNINTLKRIVPIKQYSNKFLRQSNTNKVNKIRDKNIQNMKYDQLVIKHKKMQMQKRYAITRHNNICKTQPNQNQYKCFATSYSFHKPQNKHLRMKTQQEINRKNQENFQQFQQNRQIDQQFQLKTRKKSSNIDNRLKTKIQPTVFTNFHIQQKISASRALQLYSKLLSKDKNDIAQKMRTTSYNQKSLINDKILQNTKNLQTKQITMFQKEKEKEKKIVTHNFEKRVRCKSNMRFRTKMKTQVKKIVVDDNYQLKGWDVIY